MKKLKQRDPSWDVLRSKRESGAGGAHRDKRWEERYGDPKHRGHELDDLELGADDDTTAET